MAKVKGPLLSMRASGTIAKTNVYASWRGIPYARIHVVPTNPRTVGQLLTRDVFRWINALYRSLGATAIAPWEDATLGRPLTPRNSAVKNNLANLRTDLTLVNLVASPGSHGGPALETFSAVAGVGAASIDVTLTHGTLPTGWTLSSFGALAIKTQVPTDPFENDIGEATGAVSPTDTIQIVGLTSLGSYNVFGWAEYLRPDGSKAFSPSNSVAAAASV